MTHIENIPHIIKYGLTHHSSKNGNKNYRSIGDVSIISTRKNFKMPNGESLSDYIPFYFGRRTPMLYVIQNGYNNTIKVRPNEIIYCATTIQKIIDANIDYVYTDGHACDGFTEFYSPNDMTKINEQIDFEALVARYWTESRDLKRKKEAEFLIKQDLEYENIVAFGTYDSTAKQKLVKLGIDSEKIIIANKHYF